MAKLPALPFIRSTLTAGLSANQSYRQFQQLADESGLQGIRRQDYLRLYSETAAARGAAVQGMYAPRDQLPERITQRGTIRARGYGSWVSIYQRTRGQSDLIHTPFLIKSSEPITPAEAEARALDYLNQEPDAYNRVTLGVGYLHTEEFTPRPM